MALRTRRVHVLIGVTLGRPTPLQGMVSLAHRLHKLDFIGLKRGRGDKDRKLGMYRIVRELMKYSVVCLVHAFGGLQYFVS